MPLSFFNTYSQGINFLIDFWWTWVPVILFFGFVFAWQFYVKQRTIDSINWVLLEIKTPTDIEKSPKVTEQIFAGLHGVLIPLNWRKRFFYGDITAWFSLEVVGTSGEIHFYVRTPDNFRNLVEAQIFAQYPDAEISEVEDYIHSIPAQLPNEEYDFWGTEFKLSKPDVYPIKTYYEFEEAGGLGEAKRVDPLASFTEVLSNLKSGENIWVQFIVQPTGSEVGDEWAKEGERLVQKLSGKKESKKAARFGVKMVNFLDAILPGGKSADKKEERAEFKLMMSPAEKEVAEAVNRSIGKLGFRSGVRFLYIARKEMFHMSHVAGIMGALKQFASQNLNSFRPESKTLTNGRGWFSFLFPSEKGFFHEQDLYMRKIKLYRAARRRRLPLAKPFILNTEELATLYHLPGLAVRAPLLPRIQSKKGQSPATLPID